MLQSEVLDILKTGRSAFVTGPAGSGKTHVINEYVAYLRAHGVTVAITASTGIAASHMGGMTIHSWSGMGLGQGIDQHYIDHLKTKPQYAKRYERTKVLVVDEVSLLSHEIMDVLDRIARGMKDSSLPFGGLQVIVSGDFFQLPPISKYGEPPARFAYHSSAWNGADFAHCYLEEQHRQKGGVYLDLLSAVRNGEVSDVHRALLETRMDSEVGKDTLHLYTKNVAVDEMNAKKLALLPGEEFMYPMMTKGRASLVESLKKGCLAPDELRLKVGARVMFVKNSLDHSYVNGTLGIVSELGDGEIVVKTTAGKTIHATRTTWTIEEDGKVKAEIGQYPLRLAWPITVHKSQGMSLDSARIDLGHTFAPGMGYVALSRLRTLEGLSLVGLDGSALRVHPEALEYDEIFREESEGERTKLSALPVGELENMQREFLFRIAPPGMRPVTKEAKVPTHEITKALLPDATNIRELADLRNLAPSTIISHLETLRKEERPAPPSPEILRVVTASVPPAIIRYIEEALASIPSDHPHPKTQAKELLPAHISYTDIDIVRLLR